MSKPFVGHDKVGVACAGVCSLDSVGNKVADAEAPVSAMNKDIATVVMESQVGNDDRHCGGTEDLSQGMTTSAFTVVWNLNRASHRYEVEPRNLIRAGAV